MRTVFSLGLVLVLAGAGQAKGLQFRFVDASSGAPVAGATVERWASQWQPRILMPPGRFWFPQNPVTSDARGIATLEQVASDDWYSIKAAGYEDGVVKRVWFKYLLSYGAGGPSHEVVGQSGTLVIPLRPPPAR